MISTITTGQIIGKHYQIIEQIGRGGFGITFKAIDIEENGRVCVVKQFKPQDPKNWQKGLELFGREAHKKIPVSHKLQLTKTNYYPFWDLTNIKIKGCKKLSGITQTQSSLTKPTQQLPYLKKPLTNLSFLVQKINVNSKFKKLVQLVMVMLIILPIPHQNKSTINI